jgi:hypothetical protein
LLSYLVYLTIVAVVKLNALLSAVHLRGIKTSGSSIKQEVTAPLLQSSHSPATSTPLLAFEHPSQASQVLLFRENAEIICVYAWLPYAIENYKPQTKKGSVMLSQCE